MPNPISPTFCVIPWIHRHTDEQGYHKLCCIADGPGNQLSDETGALLHISQRLTDAQVLNSPKVRQARRTMLKGKWPVACLRCQQVEESGGESGRVHLNDRFDQGRYDELCASTEADGTIPFPSVRYADIRLGNVCNLTCRMCGPLASRLWVPHFNQTQPEGYRISNEDLVIFGQNNWVKTESVDWLLEESLDHVEALHFAGGEPLILPEMVTALEQCVRSGRAGQIELSYNTNMTVLPEKVTSLWHHFKSVSILASVDGYGRTTEYIRRPSKWADIDRNLHTIDRHFDEWKIKWCTVSCTTQISNILALDKLFTYLREAKFVHVTPLPQIVPLFYPNYLSIQALPAAAKKVARKLLNKELVRAEALNVSGYAGPIGSIRSVLSFLDAADTSAILPEFLFFTEQSDKAFGDDWRVATPELAYYLDPNRPRGLSGLIQRITQPSA